MSSAPATTPESPYYAVIFTSLRTDEDENGYAEMARRMEALAAEQPGYLGFESARSDLGISVSYWRDLDSIRAWHQNLEHQEAQRFGKQLWYASYRVRICRVEREYGTE